MIGTPEDPEAVRSRWVATQVNTDASEDVTKATPPIKASRIVVSRTATKTNAKGQRDCLIARQDIRVAFIPCEGERASRDHSSEGIGTARSRMEMCESVVRNTRGEQVLGK